MSCSFEDFSCPISASFFSSRSTWLYNSCVSSLILNSLVASFPLSLLSSMIILASLHCICLILSFSSAGSDWKNSPTAWLLISGPGHFQVYLQLMVNLSLTTSRVSTAIRQHGHRSAYSSDRYRLQLSETRWLTTLSGKHVRRQS